MFQIVTVAIEKNWYSVSRLFIETKSLTSYEEEEAESTV